MFEWVLHSYGIAKSLFTAELSGSQCTCDTTFVMKMLAKPVRQRDVTTTARNERLETLSVVRYIDHHKYRV